MKWAARALCVGMAISAVTAVRAQQPASRRLTLQDAIGLALKQNLSVRVASTQIEELKGSIERQKSTLLPHADADAMINRENVDLAALGISIPGIKIPMVVGPFSYYDFRVSGSQSVIDRRAYHNWKASEKQEDAAKLDYQDTRDLVIRQTAGLYFDSQAAAAEVEAAQSRITTSETLEKLARDQHAQGLANGVDVVRAQVQLARDRQTLLVARDAYHTSLLALAHYLGLSPGVPMELAEPMKFHPLQPVQPEQALATALQTRSDYAALAKQHDSLEEQIKASRARYYPTLSVSANYGAIGRPSGSAAGTGAVQGTLSVTVFDRDRAGEKTELESQLKRLSAQTDDLKLEIEQEIRKALLDIESTENQVAVTDDAVHLAERELTLAEDRFRNGVTDNIEVVTAQTSLAGAQDDHITALAQHADSVMALVRAMGGGEKTYRMYLSD